MASFNFVSQHAALEENSEEMKKHLRQQKTMVLKGLVGKNILLIMEQPGLPKDIVLEGISPEFVLAGGTGEKIHLDSIRAIHAIQL